MTESNKFVGSWAIETDTDSKGDKVESVQHGFFAGTKSYRDALNVTDLRSKIESRKKSANDDQASACQSNVRVEKDCQDPIQSPIRPRGLRMAPDNTGQKYRRERDGLSPLRSPLTSDQRSSRVNPNMRRRPSGDGKKKENEAPTVSSHSTENRYNRNPEDDNPLDRDVEEQKFRRRLDLPAGEDSDIEEEESGFLDPECEEDRIAIERREKQILYGKCTDSYQLYIKTIPKDERSEDRKEHPRTPLKLTRCSRRNWDSQIKVWKKLIHHWANDNSPDTHPLEDETGSESSSKGKAEDKVEEADNNLDLNAEEEDDNFLDNFEIDYKLEEPSS